MASATGAALAVSALGPVPAAAATTSLGPSAVTAAGTGERTFTAAQLALEIAVLRPHNIGIYRLDPDGEPGGSVPRAHAALYVEQMNFTRLGSWSLS